MTAVETASIPARVGIITDATRHNTFHRQLLPAWDRTADDVAVACGAESHTFAQHRERVFRLVDACRTQLGLEASSRYAVLALNSIEYLELYHAAYLGAGIINPLNIRLAADELTFILEDSGTEVVFVDRMFAPVVAALRERLPSLRSVVLLGAREGLSPDVRVDAVYADLIEAGSPTEPPETEEHHETCLMYTGGTTGAPKGVVHTQRSLTICANLIERMLGGVIDSDSFLIATPMFHAASLTGVATCPLLGTKVIIVPSFAPDTVLDTVEDTGASMLVLVPVMIRMLLDDPAYEPHRLSSVRLLGYGSSPMPQGLLDRIQAQHPTVDLIQSYGTTEGNPITMLDAVTHRAGGPPLRSAGRMAIGCRVQVQDVNGNEVSDGEPGEICCRSGALMHEYWKRPDATAEAFRGGWYHTGDIGYIENGFVYLVDRAKDMIITGGENVYSAEVESAISTHPDVADVAVIGIPSEVWGEAVHAVVVPRPGADLRAEDVVDHARQVIAGYKVPRSVELRTEPLPISGAGKTLKRALRDPYWQGSVRRVN